MPPVVRLPFNVPSNANGAGIVAFDADLAHDSDVAVVSISGGLKDAKTACALGERLIGVAVVIQIIRHILFRQRDRSIQRDVSGLAVAEQDADRVVGVGGAQRAIDGDEFGVGVDVA